MKQTIMIAILAFLSGVFALMYFSKDRIEFKKQQQMFDSEFREQINKFDREFKRFNLMFQSKKNDIDSTKIDANNTNNINQNVKEDNKKDNNIVNRNLNLDFSEQFDDQFKNFDSEFNNFFKVK